MIVVKVELHGARTGQVAELGRMYLFNDGTGTDKQGHYDVMVCRKGSIEPGSARRKGRVVNWPKRSYSIMRLVTRALLECFPEEKRWQRSGSMSAPKAIYTTGSAAKMIKPPV